MLHSEKPKNECVTCKGEHKTLYVINKKAYCSKCFDKIPSGYKQDTFKKVYYD